MTIWADIYTFDDTISPDEYVSVDQIIIFGNNKCGHKYNKNTELIGDFMKRKSIKTDKSILFQPNRKSESFVIFLLGTAIFQRKFRV